MLDARPAGEDDTNASLLEVDPRGFGAEAGSAEDDAVLIWTFGVEFSLLAEKDLLPTLKSKSAASEVLSGLSVL